MKKFWQITAILLAAASLRLAAGGKVIFVHGWDPVAEDHTPAIEKLQEIFPDSRVELYRWNAVTMDFQEAAARADSEAERLSAALAALPDEELSKITLIGHSLGGRIVIKAMAKLAGQHRKIRRGIFLASAINDDDPAIAAAITASHLPNINIYNRRDYVLRHAFTAQALAEKRSIFALGAFGTAEAVSTGLLRQKSIHDDDPAESLAEYLERLQAHRKLRYLDWLQENLAELTADFPDRMDSSTARDDFEFPQSSGRIRLPDEVTLLFNGELLDSTGNWRLMHLRKPGSRWGIYYIVDPRDRIVYYHLSGTIVRRQFERLKNR